MAAILDIHGDAKVLRGFKAAVRELSPLLDVCEFHWDSPESITGRIFSDLVSSHARWVIPSETVGELSDRVHGSLGFSNVFAPKTAEIICYPYCDTAGGVTVAVVNALPEGQGIVSKPPLIQWRDCTVWLQPMQKLPYGRRAPAQYVIGFVALRPGKSPIVRPWGVVVMCDELDGRATRQSAMERSLPMPPCPIKPSQIYAWHQYDSERLDTYSHSPWLIARYIVSIATPALAELTERVFAESWDDANTHVGGTETRSGDLKLREHERKRHQRRLRDGRVIWVRKTKVNARQAGEQA